MFVTGIFTCRISLQSSMTGCFVRLSRESDMEHDMQAILALIISAALSLIAWGWARWRLRG